MVTVLPHARAFEKENKWLQQRKGILNVKKEERKEQNTIYQERTRVFT
jgi:hypothetical protein